MRARTRRQIALACAGALAVGAVTIASAQDRLGGRTLVLTFGQALRYSDNIDLLSNPDGSVLQSRSTLGIAFDSNTRTQRFSFDTGGVYEIDTDGDSDLSEPYARATYGLEGANSRLDLFADYRRVDLDDLTTTRLVSPIDPDTGVILPPVVETARIEEGVRTSTDSSLRFETGMRSNIGFVLNLSERALRYSQTTDPDLFDSRTRRAEGVVTFRIDPQIAARLTGSRTRYTADDIGETSRDERRIGVGTTLAVSPTLSIDAGLSQQRIERTDLSGTAVTDGLAYDLALTQALRNGTIGAVFDSQPTLNGRRDTLRANRALTLRREGTLAYGLGLTRTDGFSAEPLVTLAYSQPLRRGRFDIDFTQEARTDELDEEAVILTRLSANYAMPLTARINWSLGLAIDDVSAREETGEDRRAVNLRTDITGQISEISSWSAGIVLSDTDTSAPSGDETRRRYGITLGYRRQMTRDWDMVASYSHNAIEETGAGDRSANTVTLGVERAFSFRP